MVVLWADCLADMLAVVMVALTVVHWVDSRVAMTAGNSVGCSVVVMVVDSADQTVGLMVVTMAMAWE